MARSRQGKSRNAKRPGSRPPGRLLLTRMIALQEARSVSISAPAPAAASAAAARRAATAADEPPLLRELPPLLRELALLLREELLLLLRGAALREDEPPLLRDDSIRGAVLRSIRGGLLRSTRGGVLRSTRGGVSIRRVSTRGVSTRRSDPGRFDARRLDPRGFDPPFHPRRLNPGVSTRRLHARSLDPRCLYPWRLHPWRFDARRFAPIDSGRFRPLDPRRFAPLDPRRFRTLDPRRFRAPIRGVSLRPASAASRAAESGPARCGRHRCRTAGSVASLGRSASFPRSASLARSALAGRRRIIATGASSVRAAAGLSGPPGIAAVVRPASAASRAVRIRSCTLPLLLLLLFLLASAAESPGRSVRAVSRPRSVSRLCGQVRTAGRLASCFRRLGQRDPRRGPPLSAAGSIAWAIFTPWPVVARADQRPDAVRTRPVRHQSARALQHCPRRGPP